MIRVGSVVQIKNKELREKPPWDDIYPWVQRFWSSKGPWTVEAIDRDGFIKLLNIPVWWNPENIEEIGAQDDREAGKSRLNNDRT